MSFNQALKKANDGSLKPAEVDEKCINTSPMSV